MDKVFINDQLHERPERKNRSAPNGFGRLDGAPKKLADPHALAHGAKHVTAPSHEWAHGAPIQDEPMTTKLGYGKTVPIHNGMNTKTPEARGANYGPDEASRVLGDSLKISTPHGSARLDKAARLPTKNVGR